MIKDFLICLGLMVGTSCFNMCYFDDIFKAKEIQKQIEDIIKIMKVNHQNSFKNEKHVKLIFLIGSIILNSLLYQCSFNLLKLKKNNLKTFEILKSFLKFNLKDQKLHEKTITQSSNDKWDILGDNRRNSDNAKKPQDQKQRKPKTDDPSHQNPSKTKKDKNDLHLEPRELYHVSQYPIYENGKVTSLVQTYTPYKKHNPSRDVQKIIIPAPENYSTNVPEVTQLQNKFEKRAQIIPGETYIETRAQIFEENRTIGYTITYVPKSIENRSFKNTIIKFVPQ